MYKVCEVFILIFVVFIGNFSQKLKSVAELKQVLHGDLGPGQLYNYTHQYSRLTRFCGKNRASLL